MSAWHWIDLGSDGEPYPFALRGLTHARGVYLIRDKRTKSILYAGSSKNALYSTVTRHLQGWRRAKKWWTGAHYGKAHDPGVVYKRSAVEVAVQVMHGSADHLAREAELIAEYEPRDNLVGHPDGSADDGRPVPF